MLGLPARFDLTPAQIEQAFLRRVAANHPDRVMESDDNVVDSAALNHARAILLDFERRANALLEVLVGNTAPGPSDKRLPAGFLAEMMETREAIEADLSADGHAASAKWRGWADARREEYIAAAAALFAQTPPPLADLRATLNAWRYVERMIEQLDPAQLPDQGRRGT